MSEAIGVDLTANDENPLFSPGQVISLSDNGDTKQYRYVQYSTGAGTVAAVAGNIAYIQKVATAGTVGYIVTSDLSDSDEVGAGVLQAALTDDYYGWVQVTGPATITPALTAGGDGDPLTATGAGADGTLDVSAAVTDCVCAYAIDASAKVIMCAFPH